MRSLLVYILIFLALHGYAQEMQSDNNSIEIDQVLKDYLAHTGLDSFLIVDGCELGDKLTCKLQIRDNASIDNESVIWDGIQKAYQTRDIISLEKRIYLALQAVSDNPVVLKIGNGKSFNGYVYSMDGKLTSSGFASRSVTSEIKDSILIDEHLFKDVIIYDVYNTSCKKENVSAIYDFLEEKIKASYEERGIKCTTKTYYDPLTIMVSEVKGEVLGESFIDLFSGYEKLLITIQLDLEDEQLKIGTSLDARIANGMFKSPSSNSYWEMDEDYLDDVKDYIQEFTKSKIVDWLRN